MAKPIITILGLGTTGTSLGLALQAAEAQAEIVGHDKVPEAAQAARRLNAAQRIEWNLHAACEGASLVVLAMPLDEADETLALIAEDLRPNALVFVLSDVLQGAADLLAKHLPRHGHAVVGHPILNGVGGPLAARSDLFQKAVFVVAAGANTDPAALELASSFVESVGAQPLFMDPVEHDGIIAGVEQLPQLLGLALVHMLAGSPGWFEAQRLAGRTFAQSSESGRSAQHLFKAMRSNRALLWPRIEQFERELEAWKRWLMAEPDDQVDNRLEGQKTPAGAQPKDAAASQDAGHPLAAALADSVEERQKWESQAELQEWTPSTQPPVETQPSSGLLRQMFFGSLGSKKQPKGDR
jgi:prephenate dehydrogenase